MVGRSLPRQRSAGHSCPLGARRLPTAVLLREAGARRSSLIRWRLTASAIGAIEIDEANI
jgi:hypothetical protein